MYKILFDEFVYLFCGAREGAKAVLPPSTLAGKCRVPTKDLQAALGTKMESMEIEDFLCVCKTPLQYLASTGAASVCLSGVCGKGSGK